MYAPRRSSEFKIHCIALSVVARVIALKDSHAIILLDCPRLLDICRQDVGSPWKRVKSFALAILDGIADLFRLERPTRNRGDELKEEVKARCYRFLDAFSPLVIEKCVRLFTFVNKTVAKTFVRSNVSQDVQLSVTRLLSTILSVEPKLLLLLPTPIGKEIILSLGSATPLAQFDVLLSVAESVYGHNLYPDQMDVGRLLALGIVDVFLDAINEKFVFPILLNNET